MSGIHINRPRFTKYVARIHINRPWFTEYMARWRRRGARKYVKISSHRTKKAAMRAAFKFVIEKEGTGHPWFLVDVLAYQDWYGWTQIIEVKQ